jgi:hypothetical protein
MSYLYPKIEFLELFDEEKIIDEEVEIAKYIKKIGDEFRLELY